MIVTCTGRGPCRHLFISHSGTGRCQKSWILDDDELRVKGGEGRDDDGGRGVGRRFPHILGDEAGGA